MEMNLQMFAENTQTTACLPAAARPWSGVSSAPLTRR